MTNQQQTVCPLEIAKKLKAMGIEFKAEKWAADTRKGWKEYNQINGVFIPFEGIDLNDDEIEFFDQQADAAGRMAGYNKGTPLAIPRLHDLPETLQLIGEKKDWQSNQSYKEWHKICRLWLKSPEKAWEYLSTLLN